MRFKNRIKHFCGGNKKLYSYFHENRIDREDIFIRKITRKICKLFIYDKKKTRSIIDNSENTTETYYYGDYSLWKELHGTV